MVNHKVLSPSGLQQLLNFSFQFLKRNGCTCKYFITSIDIVHRWYFHMAPTVIEKNNRSGSVTFKGFQSQLACTLEITEVY